MPIRQSDFEDAGLMYKQGSFKMYSPEEWSLILEVYRKMLVEDSKIKHAATEGTQGLKWWMLQIDNFVKKW